MDCYCEETTEFVILTNNPSLYGECLAKMRLIQNSRPMGSETVRSRIQPLQKAVEKPPATRTFMNESHPPRLCVQSTVNIVGFRLFYLQLVQRRLLAATN